MNDILFTPIRLSELETLIQHSVERAMRTVHRADPTEKDDQLLTVDGAAEFLDCAKPTIYQKTSKGELPFMKRGKKLYFLKKDLIDYLKAGRNITNAEIEANPEEYLHVPRRRRA